jgi:hypothetical protein
LGVAPPQPHRGDIRSCWLNGYGGKECFHIRSYNPCPLGMSELPPSTRFKYSNKKSGWSSRRFPCAPDCCGSAEGKTDLYRTPEQQYYNRCTFALPFCSCPF